MANQPISTLPRTTEIHGVDTELFPFDQTGQTVAITGTNLLAQLLSLINGHGGIDSISEPVVSGRNKTYTITFDDGTTTTFTVTDGNGIASYDVAYAIGDDPTDPTVTYGDYSDTLPEATDAYPFTWTRLTLTDDDGVNTVVYSVGYKGKDGETVTGSEISYGISSSATVPPSSFSPTPVSATTSNPYQWTRIETSYSDSALDTTAYCVAGTPFVSVDAVTATTLPAGASATATVSNVISGAENEMSFAFGIPQGEKGETGDYIDPVMSYGTSSSAVTEPTTWYNSPTSLDYSAGKFIWAKTDYTLSGAQTVQRTIKSIIGYIGANGSGSGTVTQVTFNGVAYLDDGTGNVSINVDPDDVGAIANPSVKNNGQVLTYDSTAGEWVAANPSTGNVNTVNNVGVTAGTTDIALKGTDIPIDSNPSTGKAVVTDSNGKLAASGVTATELGYLSGVTSGIQTQINGVSGDVSGKVSKSGDTMTGALTVAASTPSQTDYVLALQNPDYVIGDPNLQGNSMSALRFVDKNGTTYSLGRAFLMQNGATRFNFSAVRPVGNSTVQNGFYVQVASDGARTVGFDDAAAWRSGLNAVYKAGDTMTGNLTIDNGGQIIIKNSDYASGDTPSPSSYRYYYLLDKNNHEIGYFASVISSTQSGLQLRGYSYATGSPVFNQLGLYVDKQGNRSVSINDPSAWRDALGLGNTSGALPIANGGTGQTGTSSSVTTVSSVASAASNFRIDSVNYVTWGKVAMVQIVATRTGASVTTAGNMQVCTLVSGKRPVIIAVGATHSNTIAYTWFNASGSVYTYGTWAQNTQKTIVSTYILP